MASPLVETKLYAPKPRRGLVSRPRLSGRLSRGSASRLTLISAPAGFGKTTLLAEWLATAGTESSVAWLSLDETDRQPAGSDVGVAMGALLEVLLIIANVGTAVALFPILKRQSEALSLGYVTARLVECTFIAIGIVSLLAVVTLRRDLAGIANGDPSSFQTVAKSLVAVHDWTFLLGPGFIVGVGNGLILGYLMYRSGLVPRAMALLGIIAGPVLCAGGIAALSGAIEPDSALKALAAAPEFVWELSLGIYLLVKGFKSSGVDRLQADRRVLPTSSAVAAR